MYLGRLFRELKIALYVAGRGEVKLDTFAERAMFVGESMGGDAENEARSKRARDSWDRRRAEGKPTSNKVPYGLQLQGERDIPIPDSAEWVRKAFEWYAEGFGSYTIGKRMDGNAPPHTWLTTRVGEDGQRIPKTRAGTRWESLRVVKLLRQKRYRGTIVEPSLFDAVQQRLDQAPKSGSRRIREYPLSGAMSCEGCGRHLHGVSRGGGSRQRRADGTVKIYVRPKSRYYACAPCDYAVNADRIESEFFASIGKLVADEKLLDRWIAMPRKSADNLSSLRRELLALEPEVASAFVQEKKNRLFELALAVSINEIEFKRQMDRLDAEVLGKKSRIAELRSRLSAGSEHIKSVALAKSLISRFDQLYSGAEYEMKRELLNALTEALGGLSVSRDGLSWIAQSKNRAK
jgi:ribosomal protein L34E